MATMRGYGGLGPSRAASGLAAVVGLGMLLCVVLFFTAPVLGVVAFGALWILTLLGIIGFHLWNAASRRGVDHARFHFQTEASGDQSSRLRQLDQLRRDGLLSDDEFQRKRADILNEDW